MENNVAGVYLLYDHEELVYVGQSHNIIQRVGAHSYKKEFTHFVVLQPKDPEDRFALESFLIKTLQPKYNGESTMNRKTRPAELEINEKLPVLMNELQNTRMYLSVGKDFKLMRESDFRLIINKLFPWWTAPPSVFKEALKRKGWLEKQRAKVKDYKGLLFRRDKLEDNDETN